MATRIKFDEISSFLEKNSVVTSTVRQVFKNLRENCQKFGKVTDEDLLALSSFFDETLEKALEIVEKKKVTYFYTNSDIGIYQVEGSSEKIYTIFPSVNYCSCGSFKYKVSCGSQITCKHVLATIIANALDSKNSTEDFRMNNREEWPERNSHGGQFMPSNPLQMQHMFQPNSLRGITPHNWAHIPPQTMPWGTPPDSHPALVRFTAGDFSPHLIPVKRKCESSMDVTPCKMLVTEEKMAAHMRGLHISDVEPSEEVSGGGGCKEEPMESERYPKLVLSDEIKNLKTESVIPESILKKLEKPELALVIWQPPATDLDSKLKELKRLSLNKRRGKKNENKEEVEMDVAMEPETESNNMDGTFRPIEPVPMPAMKNQYFQPVPQCHGYSVFSQSIDNNY